MTCEVLDVPRYYNHCSCLKNLLLLNKERPVNEFTAFLCNNQKSNGLLLFPAFFGLRGRRCFFNRLPMVQAVCDAMAIAALGETGQHASRVWCAVTALTSRHHLVFILVTGNTVYALVFSIGR